MCCCCCSPPLLSGVVRFLKCGWTFLLLTSSSLLNRQINSKSPHIPREPFSEHGRHRPPTSIESSRKQINSKYRHESKSIQNVATYPESPSLSTVFTRPSTSIESSRKQINSKSRHEFKINSKSRHIPREPFSDPRLHRALYFNRILTKANQFKISPRKQINSKSRHIPPARRF